MRAQESPARTCVGAAAQDASSEGKYSGMALSGSLREIGPTDVIQLIAMGRKSGILTVSEKGEVMSVYFREGEVCHALADQLEGPEVVYELLTRTSGKFSFDATAINVPTTISASPDSLMLEGVRRIDHWARMKDVLPPENVLLLPVPEEQARGELEEVTPDIEKVRGMIDGQCTLGDILRDSGLARFPVCDAVYELLNAGLIKPGPTAEQTAEPRREVSTESIKLSDLTPELLDRIVARIESL